MPNEPWSPRPEKKTTSERCQTLVYPYGSMFHFGVKVVLSKYFGAKVSLVLGYMDPRDTSTRVGYLPGPQRDKGLCLRLYRVLGIMFLDQTFSHVWLRFRTSGFGDSRCSFRFWWSFSTSKREAEQVLDDFTGCLAENLRLVNPETQHPATKTCSVWAQGQNPHPTADGISPALPIITGSLHNSHSLGSLSHAGNAGWKSDMLN